MHEARDLGGNDGLSLRERVDLAVVHHLDDLGLDRLPDALQLLRSPLQREAGDRRRRLADLRRGPAVGGDPEAILALELHQVAEQIELRGELGIPRQYLGHQPIIRSSISATLRTVRATICLPTYNERENLEAMIRALSEVVRPGDRVLVIDDASLDGTGEIADRLAAELGFVDVLHRARKEGLGPAYLAGFREALAGGAELVLEMDCDFSHNPADVPRLIAAAEAGADLVLGSRYVPGGSIPNWTSRGA